MPSPPTEGQLKALILAYLDAQPADAPAEAHLEARARLQTVAVELRAAIDELERRAIEAWPFGGGQVVHVMGQGSYKLGRTATKVTWDHPRAARDVIKAAWEHDEIHHPNDVGPVILAVAGLDYWRVSQLRRLGLDPHEYKEETEGRLAVRLA